jgi:pimeloyl-ACP methyl ester carboxylesterase
MPIVGANGLNLYVNRFRTRRACERPIVVCVHGLAVVDNASSSFTFGFHLAKSADVITYDLRGHGRSDKPATGYRVADHAADLLGLIDALAITEPVHLVGFSYGGAVAMVAALLRPEQMASVSLLDGHVPVAGWEEALFGSVRRFQIWEDEARALGLVDDHIVAMVIQKVKQEYGLPTRRATAISKRVHHLFTSTTLREDMEHEVVYGKDDYSRIECPVLGIYGDRSDLYWLTDRLPELIRDVTLHTIAGADHLGVFWRLDETRPIVCRALGLPAGG